MRKPIIGISGVLQEDGRFFLNQAYADFVMESGGIPFLMPFGKDSRASARLYSGKVDGILFSGGGDVHPRHYGKTVEDEASFCHEEERDIFEFELFRLAFEKQIPILGICRGMQLMAVAKGGTLFQTVPGHSAGVTHPITFFKENTDVPNAVNSYHSQAIATLPKDAEALAVSSDGICESFRFSSHPFAVGVQWHPERQKNAYDRRLFRDFVMACSVPGAKQDAKHEARQKYAP